ncbi:DUF4065 domain-containing protein (plasmid) [Lysinibacillus capsici]|uniref:type II toxin-antitoxin system antitoxin SocA domain-containing protein n=1 Tax=Lysinibacillus capsici TaxID=2115968 RepID=UPI0021DAA2EE|nr:type II toxin-antitoxin system antitoxin SocA domain-containing protein [Lysinibacillus capsici]UYB49960.1 DUF4065 domain-containing protein [Lysinibacillus capsici]
MNKFTEVTYLDLSHEQILCESCKNVISTCKVSMIKKEVDIDDSKLDYFEKIAVCSNCASELYVPEIECENNKAFQNAVLQMKKANHPENSVLNIIDEILMKYKVGKKPLSLILGWGEATISRYYKDDSTISNVYKETLETVLDNPLVYEDFLEKNKGKITEVAYKKSRKALDKELNISVIKKPKSKISSVYTYILMKTEDITPLALQKLLYFSQAFNKLFNDEFLFEDDCEAWVHGPVYRETYEEFRHYQFNPIDGQRYADLYNHIDISFKEREILDSIIENFGCYSGKILEEMTHMERPWMETRGDLPESEPCNFVIDKKLMEHYFSEVKEKYKLLNPADIADYSKALFNKIH